MSSTNAFALIPVTDVSIPFDQGNVFRQRIFDKKFIEKHLSQSLSSRAMSFDLGTVPNGIANVASQSLSSRAMSFDYSINRVSITYYVSIPFDQGNVFRLMHDEGD